MNPFDRLAPFIKEYIWRQGWSELRRMQGEAIESILGGDGHVLLAGATASGKTEAAFLPILTDLQEHPVASIGVLYVGPLKALINDQFHRLDGLLAEADIPVWPWHGDVSQAVKRRALERRRGVMQTTPESLEGFFVYRNDQLSPLFGDLRYVVIDEVHAFMASDRGRQILCQLARLEQITGSRPRRIGLSATLGDYALAADWLAGGSSTEVTTVDDQGATRDLRLGLAHYTRVDAEAPEAEETADDRNAYYEHLHRLTRGRKSLIFVNRRSDAEEIGAELRERATRTRQHDDYFVHHGSISKEYRLDAEEAMRAPNRAACTVATMTLELGIDLGHLERVIQIGPSPSVSSFVQRLGRTGRRGTPGEMFFMSLEEPPDPSDHPLERIPWTLLLMIAQIQLYVEERWVEPLPLPKRPYSLLYHQTMSTLLQHGDLTPAALAQRVLTLPPFRRVGKDDFRALLTHLIEIDHLQWTEDRRLLIGLAGERVVNDWRFLATFEDTAEIEVLHGNEHIGSLSAAPPVDTVIRLAGRTWRVDAVDERSRTVLVSKARGKASTLWSGSGGGDTHDRVVQRVRTALQEDVAYPYLHDKAHERLTEARDLLRSIGSVDGLVHATGPNSAVVLPWAGTRAFRTIAHTLAGRGGRTCVEKADAPFFIMVNRDVQATLSLLSEPITTDEIAVSLPDEAVPPMGKFGSYLPTSMRRSAYIDDVLDIEQTRALLVTSGLRGPLSRPRIDEDP